MSNVTSDDGFMSVKRDNEDCKKVNENIKAV